MKTIYLIHGFNVDDDGEKTLGWLRDFLTEAGFRVKMVKYGWVWRVRVRLCNSRLAKLWASTAEKGSIAIGHSNGCDLIYRASMEGAPFRKVILLNPALNSDATFPKHIDHVTVFYSPSDAATGIAKWIPFSNWGDMGTVGYTGFDDGRVTQYNEEDITRTKMGHSDIAKYPNLFGQIIKQICLD